MPVSQNSLCIEYSLIKPCSKPIQSDRSTISTDTHTTVAKKQLHAMKKKASNQTINNRKTLFVSGLKSDVKAKDIRHHFIDTTKVIIKACRRASHLKYAIHILFVLQLNQYYFSDMLQLVTVHLKQPKSIFNDLLIHIFLVINVVQNTPIIVLFPLVINKRLTQRKLWLLKYR